MASKKSPVNLIVSHKYLPWTSMHTLPIALMLQERFVGSREKYMKSDQWLQQLVYS